MWRTGRTGAKGTPDGPTGLLAGASQRKEKKGLVFVSWELPAYTKVQVVFPHSGGGGGGMKGWGRRRRRRRRYERLEEV